MTSQELATAVAHHVRGDVVEASIAETLDGWTAGVTVRPTDRRRRPVKFSEYGDTRLLAVSQLIEHAGLWADAFNIFKPEVSSHE